MGPIGYDMRRTELAHWTQANPWEYIQDWDRARVGDMVDDAEQRANWMVAAQVAGGLPYIWRELARQISDIAYGLLEVRAGDRVLLIGEGIKPAGWDEDLRGIVTETGQVDTFEIILDGREAVLSGRRGRNGKGGCWRWDYVDDVEDNYYDCVAIMQATQHSDDWDESAQELTRVLKPGRRIVLAEAVLMGTTFDSRVEADVHLAQWVAKLFAHMPPDAIPYYSPEEISTAFAPYLTQAKTLEWRGIEMFWGRKLSR